MDRRAFVLASLALAGCRMSDNPGQALRSITGSAPAYAGYASNALFSDFGEGLKVSGPEFRVRDYDISRINGAAVLFEGTSAWQDMGVIDACKLRDSWKGISAVSGAEGLSASNNSIANCVFGVHINSGNNALIGGQIVYCSIGIKIGDAAIGANDSHGIVSGVVVRHCTYLAVCQNVTAGELFVGCQFTAGQTGSDQGVIQLVNSKGINFTGCEFAYCDITVDATSQLDISHCAFRGPVNVTVASGGVFKSSNPVLMNGVLTLNGSNWNGAA